MSAERTVFRALASALVLAVSLATSAAGAQSEGGDKALAESLFQAGKDLMKEGKVDDACPKFAESNRIDPSAGTLLNLGKCLEAQGKTASAWAAYKEAIVIARAAGQTKRVEAGQQFATEIEPKLSRLRIDAQQPPQGLVVKRDGVAIGAAAIGVSVAIDPGEHTIEASAPGHASWSSKITIAQDGDRKTLTVPTLERLEGVAAAPSTSPSPAPTTTSPATPAPADDGAGTRRTLGFIVGGAGVVSLGVGIVFGILTLSAASDAKEDEALCPQNRCTPEGLDAIDSARGKALVSTLGIGIGVAAIAGGAVLLATSGPWSPAPSGRAARPARAGVRVTPTVGSDVGGVLLSGAF